MDIDLYTTDSAKNVLNKKLTKVKTIDGTILEYDQNVNNLRINLYTSDIFNYVYIPDFKRYYFVNDVSISENGIKIYDLACDLLMTFADIVKQSIIKLDGNSITINQSSTQIDRTPTNIFIVLNRVQDNNSMN